MGWSTLLKTQHNAGNRIVVLTVAMVVLAGVMSGGAALWHTLHVANSYDNAIKDEVKQKALAYGQIAGYFLDALGPAGFPALQSVADKALANGNGERLGEAQFSNTLVAFEAWVPDAAEPGGFRRIYDNHGGTGSAQEADVVTLIAKSVATGEAATVLDEAGHGQIHVAIPVRVNGQTQVVAVGTISAEREFAFISRQRSEAIHNGILLSIAITGFVSLVGGGLSFLVSRTLTSRKRVEEALREQARRDRLTGALNHGAIVDELRERASASGKPQPFAVVMADVDGMKATNDTYGHPVGDRVLQTVASALEVDGALLGRYGGDEFVAVLPGADRTAAQRYHSNVTERLRGGNVIDRETGAEVPVSVTLGVAFFPEDADSVLDLIKLSDNAMYAARRARPVISDGRQMPLREDERAARVVGELVPLLVAEGSLSAKLRQLAYRLCTGAGYDAVTIALFAEEPGGPAISHTVGRIADEFASAWDSFMGEEGFVTVPIREQLERTRRPLILNDIQSNEQLNPELRELLRKTDMKSGVVAPMLWQDRTLGSLGIASRQANAFGARDAQFLVSVATQVTAIVRMAKLLDDLRATTARLADAQDETVMLLAAAAEAHDAGLSHHFQGVRSLAETLARELGYGEEEAREVGLAAALHDVGKIRVAHTALSSNGPLSAEQWEMMKQHTIWGETFFTGRTGFRLAAVVARSHHEYWDGSGYPDGLAGDQIPEVAAITSVADAFDAIVNVRSYRAARSTDEAVQEIVAASGKQFSPRLVEALVRLHARGALPSALSSIQRAAA